LWGAAHGGPVTTLPTARKRRHAMKGAAVAISPNYITPEGARRLSDELARLRSAERPRIVQEVADAAAQGDRSENAEYIYGKKKLREIDRRMRHLTKRLADAVVVDPRKQQGDKVFFGATVEIEDENGARSTHQIVGEDEIDGDAARISW